MRLTAITTFTPRLTPSILFITMLNSFGSTEIIIIAIVLLVIFGPKKLPEFIRGLGESVNEFKKATKDPEEKSKDEN